MQSLFGQKGGTSIGFEGRVECSISLLRRWYPWRLRHFGKKPILSLKSVTLSKRW